MSQQKFTIDVQNNEALKRRDNTILALERRRLYWFGFALLIILLDQLTKWYVTEMILRPAGGADLLGWYINPPPPLPFVGMEITSFFNLVMVWNPGVSFGMFGKIGGIMPYILIGLALVISGLFTKWMLETQNRFHGLCYAMIIGGALGNVIDRARFGAVVDFLDFHAFGRHWPAFNIADMAVCIGVGLLITTSLLFDLREKQSYRKKHKKT